LCARQGGLEHHLGLEHGCCAAAQRRRQAVGSRPCHEFRDLYGGLWGEMVEEPRARFVAIQDFKNFQKTA